MYKKISINPNDQLLDDSIADINDNSLFNVMEIETNNVINPIIEDDDD